MRKITEIYKQYNIMPNLQLHQLRVAAVAYKICDSLDISIDKDSIIVACLFHDMGNIVKSDLGYFPDFEESQNIGYWQKIKNEFIEKYSSNEHEATSKIIEEINLPDGAADLIDRLRFHLVCKDKEEDDFNMKIMHYADMRVGPYGILSYNERMIDAKKRYQNRENHSVDEEERQKLVECGCEIEKQIFSHSNSKPEDINDRSTSNIVEGLKNYEI